MKTARGKSTRRVADAYDVHLMEQIEAQLALMREMAQLATELRTCVVEIERTLCSGRVDKLDRFPEPV